MRGLKCYEKQNYVYCKTVMNTIRVNTFFKIKSFLKHIIFVDRTSNFYID